MTPSIQIGPDLIAEEGCGVMSRVVTDIGLLSPWPMPSQVMYDDPTLISDCDNDLVIRDLLGNSCFTSIVIT
jgi:hypothetical protein